MKELKLELDFTRRGTGMSVTSDRVEILIEPDKLTKAAGEAIAARIVGGVRSAGWVKTGTLANGIKAERGPDGSTQVTVPGDRLVRDPELATKLADAVPAVREPFTTPERDQVEKAVGDSFHVTRRAP